MPMITFDIPKEANHVSCHFMYRGYKIEGNKDGWVVFYTTFDSPREACRYIDIHIAYTTLLNGGEAALIDRLHLNKLDREGIYELLLHVKNDMQLSVHRAYRKQINRSAKWFINKIRKSNKLDDEHKALHTSMIMEDANL